MIINKKIINVILTILFFLFCFLVSFGLYFCETNGNSFDTLIGLDAAYRLSLSQIPFKDFFIPTGPVSYYVLLLFFNIFGFNIVGLAYFFSITQLILTAVYFNILRKRFSFLITVIISFIYLSFLHFFDYSSSHTWLGFWLLNLGVFLIFHLFKKNSLYPIYYSLGALLTNLAFFTKQDFGIILFILFSGFFLINVNWKKYLIYYLLILITLLFISFSYFNINSNFWDWFIISGGGDKSFLFRLFRLGNIANQFGFWAFYVLIGSFFLIMKNRVKDKADLKSLYIIILFTIASILIKSTSYINDFIGLLPITSIVIFDMISKYNLFDKKWLQFIIITIFMVLINPLDTIGSKFRIGLKAYRLDEKVAITNGLTQFNIAKHIEKIKTPTGLFKGGVDDKASYFFLEKLKQEVIGTNFLNLTNYSHLYLETNTIPPVGFPIWFHYNITYNDQHKNHFIKQIAKQNPTIILLDNQRDFKPQDWLVNAIVSLGYKQSEIMKDISADKLVMIFKKLN